MCTYAVIAFSLLILIGCRPNEDQIARDITPLLTRQLVEKPEYKEFGLTVDSVDVLHEEGNKYRGIAKIRMNGQVHDVPMTIVSDGKKLMYEIPSTGLAFVAQEVMRKAMADAQKTISQLDADEMPPNIKALADQVDELNDKCRGRPGDDPEGMKACKDEAAIGPKIRESGWCWGHKDDFGYQKKWGRCRPGD